MTESVDLATILWIVDQSAGLFGRNFQVESAIIHQPTEQAGKVAIFLGDVPNGLEAAGFVSFFQHGMHYSWLNRAAKASASERRR